MTVFSVMLSMFKSFIGGTLIVEGSMVGNWCSLVLWDELEEVVGW